MILLWLEDGQGGCMNVQISDYFFNLVVSIFIGELAEDFTCVALYIPRIHDYTKVSFFNACSSIFL